MNRPLIARTAAALALLALAACDKPDNAPGPGGVSMGEAKALDEAAEMLDGETASAAGSEAAAPAPKPT